MKKFILNCDGASRGNPGHSAAGFVIADAEGVIWVEEGIYLGISTNNEAEYKAVKSALERLLKDFTKYLPTEIEIRVDSNLIASQLSGKFKIKNERLKVFYNQIKNLEKDLGQVKYNYKPRSENFLADKLANLAIDRYFKHD